MSGKEVDSSPDPGPTGPRRFSKIRTARVGVLTGITIGLAAILALLIATSRFDSDKTDPAKTSPAAASNSAAGSVMPTEPQPGLLAPHLPPDKRPCSDGRDNDTDGKTDFGQDPGCYSPDDMTEREASCTDGIDNDDDGKTDFGADPDCSSPDDWIEKRLECSDGVDNDDDGKTDVGQDPDCTSARDLTEHD